MNKLDNKFIELILNRCLNFNQSKSLLIHCDLKEHFVFAQKVKQHANEMGIYDVCIHINDLDEIHTYLKNTDIKDIKLNPLIDITDWNVYAKKGASLLFLNSNVPGLMDDIEEEKIRKMIIEKEKTIKYYRANVSKYTFPWCIVAMPNERWAKKVFGDVDNAYEKLYLSIMKMCMVDRENPILEWENYIKKSNYYKRRLNELEIKTMHYKNSLGTDLVIGIPEGNNFINLDKTDAKGGQMIANMPSYEIFTTPDYRKTNGVVYSSRPLIFNNCCIDEFSLVFEDGKVVSCKAKKGQKYLEKLIYGNKNSMYLGEVALVPYDSPISNTGLVFNQTLFDENASCHLALGRGFSRSFKNSESMTDEELKDRGMNFSNIHVDFMIGTSDLEIEAETKEGKKLIFKKGNFNI